MNKSLLLILFAIAPSFSVLAGTRSSRSYNVVTDSVDFGGRRATSTAYTNDASAGVIASVSTVGSPVETKKDGYVAQLYEVIGLVLDANPMTIDENGTRQVSASQLLDDGTKLALAASSVSWSVASGPLTSVSTGGLAAAGSVYQNTLATVQGSYNGNIGSVSLTVLNIDTDNFGSYAGDGIDDAWQVQYFGQPPNPNAGPTVDFDQTGQSNFFKYVAGLNPLDGSRFTLSITPVAGQATQKALTFNPVIAGRTYTVQAKLALPDSSWSPISVSSPLDNGTQRTVKDLNATTATKFYRIQVSKP